MKNEYIVKQYSEEFKKMIVERIENGELSIRSAMREYGIGKSDTINRWKIKYGSNPTVVRYQHIALDKLGSVVVKGG